MDVFTYLEKKVMENINQCSIPIVLVYNGIDHYVPTKIFPDLIKNGIDEICGLFSKASLICGEMLNSSNDNAFDQVMQKNLKYLRKLTYSNQELFKCLNDNEPEEKKKKLQTIEQTRKKDCPLTKEHCECGLLVGGKDQLIQHKEEMHRDNWDCIYKNCSQKCSSPKSLKRHVLTQHLEYFLHFCKYCKYGSNDKTSTINHMVANHTHQKLYECSSEECNKTFSSKGSLLKHEEYCGEGKKYECSYCGRKFKREENMLHHTKIHTGELKKIECSDCGSSYESKSAFDNHLKGHCQALQVAMQHSGQQEDEATEQFVTDELSEDIH